MSDQKPAFQLSHPCGLRIATDLREAHAQKTDGVRTRDMNTGYVWYDLPRSELAGQVIDVSLCFFKGKLDALSVAVVNDQRYGSSWDDWSAEKEQLRAEATRAWLADIGYPVGAYPWGVVYADTDMKTGDGGGGIKFR